MPRNKEEMRKALSWCLEQQLDHELESMKSALQNEESIRRSFHLLDKIDAMTEDSSERSGKVKVLLAIPKLLKAKGNIFDGNFVQRLLQNLENNNKCLAKEIRSDFDQIHEDMFEDLYRLIDSLRNEIIQKPGSPKKRKKDDKTLPAFLHKRLQG